MDTVGRAPVTFVLEDGIRAVEPFFPKKLFDRDARRALRRIARRMPPVMTAFGFECRLRKGEPTVDLGFPVEPNGGREQLAHGKLRRGLREDAAWQRVRALCIRWAETDSLLHTWVPFLCFEFDAVSAMQKAPQPSLFVTLDSPLVRAADEPPAAAPEMGATREALPLLTGGPVPRELVAQIVGCFAALPAQARLLHVGIMLGRGFPGVRLSVASPREDVVPYLEKCGWNGSTSEIDEVLHRYVLAGGLVQFDFDIAAGVVRPKLGIGLTPRDSAAWAVLEERLVADELCSRRKRKALRAWPGASAAHLEGAGACLLARYLSHVKIGCGPGLPPEAKAYLGVDVRPSLFR